MPDETWLSSQMPFPLLPTNAKGVYTTLPIPPDFDLGTAKEAALLRHGLLPSRLRSAKDHNGHSLWDRALKHGLRKIMPQVELWPLSAKPIRRRPGGPLGHGGGGPSQNTSPNWCGCVLPGPGGWTWVTGLLTLPYLSPPPPQYLQGLPPTGLQAWVGLDGWSSDESELLQTIISFEVSQNIDTSLATFSNPTWQWYYPNPNNKNSELMMGGTVNNPPQMNSGHLIQISAEYLRATDGKNWGRVTWFFMNDSMEVPSDPSPLGGGGPPFSVPVMVDMLFPGPTSKQAPYKGVTIEWILENTSVTNPNPKVSTTVPRFSSIPDGIAPITFTDAWGDTSEVIPT